MEPSYYIGVLSGTSMDGLDAVLISVESDTISVVEHSDHPYSESLRTDLRALCSPGNDEITRMARLDNHLAELTANCVDKLLLKTGLRADNIKAIGSHGQTIRHLPGDKIHNTLQISNPNLISELTGITTVSDFRRADMACLGQGAPMVPAFHHSVFASDKEDRAIINIGGIANITVLPKDESQNVFGYDIGPGNTLMDAWCQTHQSLPYDDEGKWAKSGSLVPQLLKTFLDDEYFSQPFPKSTGIEYFNPEWLSKKVSEKQIEPSDIQRTLAELTCQSIAKAVGDVRGLAIKEVFICGGGAKNRFLLERLRTLLPNSHVMTTEALGINPQHVEAAAFAWLAYRTLNQLHGNLPAVTGATKGKILGGIYLAS